MRGASASGRGRCSQVPAEVAALRRSEFRDEFRLDAASRPPARRRWRWLLAIALAWPARRGGWRAAAGDRCASCWRWPFPVRWSAWR